MKINKWKFVMMFIVKVNAKQKLSETGDVNILT